MTEEREIMEVDVLFVGGGIASLSGALHLSNMIQAHNARVAESGEGKDLGEVSIAVLEKGLDASSHILSGAVMNPVALKELVPDFKEKEAPLESEVTKEEVLFLTKGGKIGAPIIPPPLQSHGFYVVSLSRLAGWLSGMVMENGVDIFPEFAGVEVLYDGNRVTGVRTGDKGIDAEGNQKPNYEPGIDLQAKVTVFGEGTRGSLTKTLIRKLNLDAGRNPQNWVVGVKEVWEVPEGRIQPGHIIHTMGYPLKSDTYGGGFVYGMKDNRVSVGQLSGLDYKDPYFDPHLAFQKFKLHPMVQGILKDGKVLQYGAKSVPVGGYFAVPKLTFDGGMLIGDSAGLFISMKIKGVHAAMKSGMLAAESVFKALLADDYSDAQLKSYEKAVFDSYIGQEMWKCRNFHQTFQSGLYMAMVRAGIQYALGGRALAARLGTEPDFSHLKKVSEVHGTSNPTDEQKGLIKFDGKLTYDKETDVYYSGSTHEEHQPPHLKIKDYDICYTRCTQEFQNPCQRFCPANVYVIEINEETGKQQLKLNFSNCVHCKTCDIKDPYENITWVPPEGGGGPKYTMV